MPRGSDPWLRGTRSFNRGDLFAKPILGATQHGDADEPAHLQFGPAFFYRDQALVGLSIRRVQDRSSGPSIAVLLKIPENPQPNDGLPLLVTITVVARGVWIIGIRVQQLLDAAVQLAVFLPDRNH